MRCPSAIALGWGLTKMGWEWHDRERGCAGRFARSCTDAQLHVRCTRIQLQHIRGRAYARRMTISGYILDLVRRDLMRTEYPELTEDGQ